MGIDLDEAKIQRNEFGLWLGWTLATAAGLVIGYLPAAFLVPELDLGISLVIVPLLAGLFIGLAQWLVLRGYVTRSQDWILNHAGGWVVAYALGLFVVQLLARSGLGGVLGTLLGYLLFGVIVALFQWPVLRREIPHLLPWALANAIGWAVGAYVSTLILAGLETTPRAVPLVDTLISNGVTGLIAGAITGLALVWIVRKPEREDLVRSSAR